MLCLNLGAKILKNGKNVREITFFGCELSSVNYNGDFTLENDKDLKIKKTGVLECWLMFDWGTIYIKAVKGLCSMYPRVCHIFLDFKVSRYIEGYSFWGI